MTKAEIFQTIRIKELDILTHVDGHTPSEVEKATGYTKSQVLKVIEKYRRYGITSKRTSSRKVYFYIADIGAIKTAVEEQYPESYTCAECGLVYPSKSMHTNGHGVDTVCKTCFRKIIERDGIVCTSCGKRKPVTCFGRNGNSATGHNQRCKECYNMGRQKSISRVQGYGFQSWAIIDTTVHLPLFLALGEKYGC